MVKTAQNTHNGTTKFFWQLHKDSDSWNFGGLDTSLVVMKYRPNIKTETISYLIDPIGLISNIGGGLGLALGFSIFSVFDFIMDKFLALLPTLLFSFNPIIIMSRDQLLWIQKEKIYAAPYHN